MKITFSNYNRSAPLPRIVLFILCCTLVGTLRSQPSGTVAAKESIFAYLCRFESVSVKLIFHVDSLLEYRMKPTEYEGYFRAFSRDSLLVNIPVKVSPRGKFRRKKCDFPPLKLNFPKGRLKDFGFSKADEYKLVTHCLKNKVGVRVLAKELMAYQMFSMLTESSYQTKLIDIDYEDLDSGVQIATKGFIIESNEELADRHDGKWCRCMGTSPDDIDPMRQELVALFQYMIGNRDMDIKTEHNVRFLMMEGKKLFPFPYDFDFSIFVKAPYAYVSTLNFQPRLYLGFPQNASLIPELKERFLELKRPFYDLIRHNKLITRGDKKWCLKYLKSFYVKLGKRSFRLPYYEEQPNRVIP